MGKVQRQLEGHGYNVVSVAYSPDGTQIVSGAHDKTVRIWDVSTIHTPRYIRQQDPDRKHTGWLLSPTDTSNYLMFVPLTALLPDDSNILTFPATAVPYLDLSNAKLGEEWEACFTPT
jgi:WD40 repeat protein